MGTKQSNEGAADFFHTIGGNLQGLSNAMTSSISAPGQIAEALSNYISSPLGGITIPIVIIGGIFVFTQLKR